MSTHHPEPSTGWEASWDATPAQDDRASRLSRLRDDEATSVLDPVRDDAPAAPAATCRARRKNRPQEDVPEEPLVPDEVETTIPVGTPDEPGGPRARGAGDGRCAQWRHHATERTPPTPTTPVRTHRDRAWPARTAGATSRSQFVDDPSGAVDGAARLVQQAIEAHAGAHGSADTEQLRQAFTRLRDLHHRLTG